MIAALILGLMGSLGHCVGMCSAVIVMLNRGESFRGSRLTWILAHGGRITTYALLGMLAGALGGAVIPGTMSSGTSDHSAHVNPLQGIPLGLIQGTVALLAGALALYFALALVGWAPSPEIYLTALTRRWGSAMKRVSGRKGSTLGAFGTGMIWGLLPCGLVLTALLTAAVSPSPIEGALRMVVFGLGTVPALLGVRWVTGRPISPALPFGRAWPRYVAALFMVGFGLQFALRGLAAWGWIEHQMVGGVMLW